MILYIRTITLIGPTRLGLFMALMPVSAALASIPLLDELLTLPTVTGLALECLGPGIGNLRILPNPRREPRPM